MTDSSHASLLRLDDVWKAYPRWPTGARTLKEVIRQRSPLRKRRAPALWALREVSLALGEGEAIGIIGPNGAGKSTLLRLAAGLGVPTRGQRLATRDLAAVLTLGSSLDLTLTGAENAVTMARVLGMDGPAARRTLPAILEFAELESFANAPVRTYSEGMKLRLAFAVVAQLRPRVLVLDELLAVGDLRFQEKCLERVRRLRDDGTALLFASHDLAQVSAHCDRVIWLDAGEVRGSGPSQEVLAAYREAMHAETLRRTPPSGRDGHLELGRNRFGSQEMRITGVRLLGPDGMPTDELPAGASLAVEFDLEGDAPETAPVASVSIVRAADGLMCVDVTSDGTPIAASGDGGMVVRAEFPPLELAPGRYKVSVGVYPPGWEHAYDYHWQAYPFAIAGGGVEAVLQVAPRWTAGRREQPRG